MVARKIAETEAITDDGVRKVVEELCPSTSVMAILPGPLSYSNRLWKIQTDEGDLLVRIAGRSTNPEVHRISIASARLASEAGVPSPRYRAFAPQTSLGCAVAIQEFQPGSGVDGDRLDKKAKISLSKALGEWVAKLHKIRREQFGPCIGEPLGRSWTNVVERRVRSILDGSPREILPADPSEILDTFVRGARGIEAVSPSLTHGDLYLENVLERDGLPICLLDFEHAAFRDRFFDFGKLRELVFDRHPDIESHFSKVYQTYHPCKPDDEARMQISLGLYALEQLSYFNTWQPDLVEFYKNRLFDWLNLNRIY